MTALDVGAAPGGWTKTLAEHPAVSRVVAVDPAGVVPAVSALPQVTVHAALAQQVVAELQAAGPYGVICCDANLESAEATALVAPVLPMLAPGGLLGAPPSPHVCSACSLEPGSLMTLERDCNQGLNVTAGGGGLPRSVHGQVSYKIRHP